MMPLKKGLFAARILFLAALSMVQVTSYAANNAQRVKIADPEDGTEADVILDSGIKKMAVLATTVVEQVFGQDPQGTTWFYFGATLEDANGIGAAGDTVRVQIPAAPSPLNAIYPAVDVTYTVVAGDLSSSNPERTVALNVCSMLNADSNFSAAEWKCTVAKDFALVHIESKLFNEFGTRSTWTLTCSGTTTCQKGEADIARRGKPTELARSPNDPRQGVLAISGTVTTTPGGIGDRFIITFKNGGSSNLLVNGSVTPVNFTIPADATRDIFVEQIRCYGGGNGIKFGQFLSKSGAGGLTNGILVTIRSEESVFSFPTIKTTEDFKNKFVTELNTDFRLDIQAGGDQFGASFRPTFPFVIRVAGSFSPDDFAEVKIRDDITSGVSSLECAVRGFYKEP